MRPFQYIACDGNTGLHLREATTEEVEAFHKENHNREPRFYVPGKPAWADNVRVGEVVVTYYNGPGESHIPGRFLK